MQNRRALRRGVQFPYGKRPSSNWSQRNVTAVYLRRDDVQHLAITATGKFIGSCASRSATLRAIAMRLTLHHIASPIWAPVREPSHGCCGIPGNKSEGTGSLSGSASSLSEQ
jgi:hypothetical protein